MRTTAFIQALLASIVLVLSGCASGEALGPQERGASVAPWRARAVYFDPTRGVPEIDTTAQRGAFRRVPHDIDRFDGLATHK